MALIEHAVERFGGREITPRDLAELMGFSAKELECVDLFWEPAFDDSWFYLSPEFITGELGYGRARDFYKVVLIDGSFRDGLDYLKVPKSHELVEKFHRDSTRDGKKPGNRASYYIVRGEILKEILMQIETPRGKQTRSYFLKVEKVVIAMTRYTCEVNNRKIAEQKAIIEQKDELIEQKDELIEQERSLLNSAQTANKRLLKLQLRLKKDQTMYVMSTPSYARQGLFKIGMTRSTTAGNRLSSINGGHPIGESMVVLKEIKCHDARILESHVHKLLENSRSSEAREWFFCHFDKLANALDIFAQQMEQGIELSNDIISSVYSDDKDYTRGLDINIFTDAPGQPAPRLKVKKFNHDELTLAEKHDIMKEAINMYINALRPEGPVVDVFAPPAEEKEEQRPTKIKLVWNRIVANLVGLCNTTKASIGVNKWKPIIEEVVKQSPVVDEAVKWR